MKPFGALTIMRVVLMSSTTMLRSARGFLRCSHTSHSGGRWCSSSTLRSFDNNHVEQHLLNVPRFALGARPRTSSSPIALFSSTPSTSSSSSSSSSSTSTSSSSTSADYALDPDGYEADAVLDSLGVDSEEKRARLRRLAALVVEWNQNVNLVSRVDCTEEVVFGRHVVPSLALASLLGSDDDDDDENEASVRVADVGTGGGFPGLPLAIVFPEHEFVLVDSVGKKLQVVREMADELGLTNVRTHHGRVEEMMVSSTRRDRFRYVLGRSVAPLPKFCFWVRDVLDDDDDQSRLLYIIGGDVPENVLNRCRVDLPLSDVVHASDKRALVLTAKSVREIADESGEKRANRNSHANKSGGSNAKSKNKRKKNKAPKGHWEKVDNSKKDRGYENFKRYNA